jgi:predicted amidohydrolase
VKIACVQSNVVFGDPAANAASAVIHLERLAEEGVDLAVFPEAFLTGYCVDSAEAALGIALDDDWEAEPVPAVAAVRDACVRHKMHAVVGAACRAGGKVSNKAFLFEPNGKTHRYSKTHLPELGLDKFVTPGDDLPVFDTALGKIGIAICFDLRPPEPIRILVLKGAELIVLPTNWPEGAEFAPAFTAAVRAAENRVFLAACNRVGTENGFTFIGKSGIWGVGGKCLASAGAEEETICADLDLAEAREKRVRTIPGKYETTVFESRRPELYGRIAGGA